MPSGEPGSCARGVPASPPSPGASPVGSGCRYSCARASSYPWTKLCVSCFCSSSTRGPCLSLPRCWFMPSFLRTVSVGPSGALARQVAAVPRLAAARSGVRVLGDVGVDPVGVAAQMTARRDVLAQDAAVVVHLAVPLLVHRALHAETGVAAVALIVAGRHRVRAGAGDDL